MTHETKGVRVEDYAYYVNKLRQNVGLETGIWRQIVTSQRANPKYKWPPYATEWNPMKIFCVRHWSLHSVPASHARTKFARKLWGDKLLLFILMTSPCSLKRRATFLQNWQIGRKLGNDVFFTMAQVNPWLRLCWCCSNWYCAMVLWSSTRFNMKTH